MLEKVDFLSSKLFHFYFIPKNEYFSVETTKFFLIKFTTFSNGLEEAVEGILYDVKI